MRSNLWIPMLGALLPAAGCVELPFLDIGDKDVTGTVTDTDPTVTGGGTDTTTTADPTDPTGPCANTIAATWPVDGEAAAFYRNQVEFTLVVAEPGALVTVTGPDGRVPGSTAVDGARVVWTADSPLAPLTSYDATLDWSCPDAAIGFATSATGEHVSAGSLVGNVYALDVAAARFVSPPGIGELLAGLLTVDLLIEVTDASASEIVLLSGISEEGDPHAQDMCSETIEYADPGDFTGNPYYEFGPEDLVFSASGLPLTMDAAIASGAFSPDGQSIEGGVLQGSIDTRPLAPLLGVQGDDGVCSLLGGFGIACTPCASGDGVFCLDIEMRDLEAHVVGADVVKVTAQDVAEDPGCP